MENKNDRSIKGRSNNMQWFAFVRPAILLLVAIVLLTYVTYSWMRREWTPYVEQEGITISTSGSLVFELIDIEGTTGTEIRDLLKLGDDFVLRPVSNCTGLSDSFFTLDLSGGDGNECYEYLDVKDKKYNGNHTEMGIQNGYIEFQLKLYSPVATGEGYYVYLHPDSIMTLHDSMKDKSQEEKDAIKCIRMSITLSNGTTFIFLPDDMKSIEGENGPVHIGVDDIDLPDADGNKWLDGQKLADLNTKYSYGGNLRDVHRAPVPNTTRPDRPGSEGKVVYLSDYMAGFSKDENGAITGGAPTAENTLFLLKADGETYNQEEVTVRIWVEGSSEYCEGSVAGAKINLKLKFSAIEVPASAGQS